MNLTAATDERNGVTLVELEVENPTRTTRRVRIQNELNGEVLPPRRHGSVVEGFDEDGLTLTIAAGARLAAGYACRAVAESPPATLVGSEPCDSTELDERSADDVLAALGDPRPPRDAITPELRPPESRTTENQEKGQADTNREIQTAESPSSGNVPAPEASACRRTHCPDGASQDSTDTKELGRRGETEERTSSTHSQTVPPALDAWLTRASERIERGDPVDAASLRVVADRADSLARRAGR